jgi:Ca-activated chloride channel homolog
MKIGLSFILIVLTLTSSSFAQSGANKQSPGQDKKNRSISTPKSETENSPSAETADDTTDSADVVRVDTNLITVPVSVYDREGRFVPGLTKADFEVLENNKPQNIEYFATVDAPFTVALVLDVSLSAKFKIDQIQTSAFQFVMGMRPQDKIMIVSFDEEVRFLTQPTNDRETLRLAINSTRFGSGTSLYETVYQTLERMKQINGRKAIVLFTDGVDTTSRKTNDADNLSQAQEFEGLVYPIHYDTYEDVQNQAANPPILTPNPVPGAPIPPPNSNGTLTIPGTSIPLPMPVPQQRRRDPQRDPRNPNDPRYPTDPTDPRGRDNHDVILTGSGTTPQEYRRGREYLDKMALNTGGRLYEANSPLNLSRAFEQIAEELRRQYSLGYYPESEGSFGERRAIKVKVNRKKVSVRARDSYTVGRKAKK